MFIAFTGWMLPCNNKINHKGTIITCIFTEYHDLLQLSHPIVIDSYLVNDCHQESSTRINR